ncbi:MAG: glycosyltransferase, partial [Candidatus Eisenbacteria bacterium]
LGGTTQCEETRRLRSLDNVFFLGRRPYEELPHYVKGLDVGLIPLKLNRLTASINPLKLYEYMAAGCPIVSTPIREVLRFNGLVNIARGVSQFEREVESLLNGRGRRTSQLLIEEARKHSWARLTSDMIVHLEQTLGKRG